MIIKKANLTLDDKSKSKSNINHLSDASQHITNNQTHKDAFHSEASINKTHQPYINENKMESLVFDNNQTNNNRTGLSNFNNITNESLETNNKTINSTENKTNLNNTQNLTNNTTLSSNGEESIKDKVCDTLLAVGYLSAAIAAGCALNPEPAASKVIGVIAVGVAAVSFVAYICIKWFW